MEPLISTRRARDSLRDSGVIGTDADGDIPVRTDVDIATSSSGDRQVRRTKPNYMYIDCVRGYAVTMVITTHVTSAFPELPYPLARVTITGWYGVQLFFLASCVTLLLSWHYERERGSVNVRNFFLRRLFRIAPAYYLTALAYFIMWPPQGGFDFLQLLASMGFVNSWDPSLMPTVSTQWMVVPGGWSIGVEFTFYFLFPFFASLATSMRRAILLLVATVAAGFIFNSLTWEFLLRKYGYAAADNFLYFWFPTQACVFALGGILFHAIRMAGGRGLNRVRERIAAHENVLILCSILTFIAASRLSLAHWMTLEPPYVPLLLPLSMSLMAFVFLLSQYRGKFWVNPVIASMGKVSFSAYLAHFAVVRWMEVLAPTVFQTTKYAAILAFCGAWVVAVLATYMIAWCSYQLVEQPMINLGRRLSRAGLP